MHLYRDPLGPSNPMEGAYFWLTAREHLSDNLGCILRLAFQPIASDVAAVSLPEQLYPLYFLIHPVRLGSNYLLKGDIR